MPATPPREWICASPPGAGATRRREIALATRHIEGRLHALRPPGGTRRPARDGAAQHRTARAQRRHLGLPPEPAAHPAHPGRTPGRGVPGQRSHLRRFRTPARARLPGGSAGGGGGGGAGLAGGGHPARRLAVGPRSPGPWRARTTRSSGSSTSATARGSRCAPSRCRAPACARTAAAGCPPAWWRPTTRAAAAPRWRAAGWSWRPSLHPDLFTVAALERGRPLPGPAELAERGPEGPARSP